ncbi:MAG: SNF2-related protein [Bacilli bacterium]
MIKLTHEEVLNKFQYLTGFHFHYNRWNQYYNEIKITTNKNKINASISLFGEDDTCSITINNGNILKTACTCEKHSYSKFCMHVAYAALKYSYIYENELKLTLEYKKNINSLIQFSEYKTVKRFNLQPILRLNYLNELILSFKIGNERLYSIRNIEKFVTSYKEKEVIEFGKEFTFDPKIHKIKPKVLSVLDRIASTTLEYKNEYIVKHIYDIMPILKNYKIDLILDKRNQNFKNCKLIKNENPIKFLVKFDENGNLVLENSNIENFIFLSDDCGLLFFNNLYLVDNDSKLLLKSLMNIYNCYNEIIIKSEFINSFISKTLPTLLRLDMCILDHTVESLIKEKNLIPEIYIDKYLDGILVNIIFNYEGEKIYPDKEIDALNPIIRNFDIEYKIMEIISNNLNYGPQGYYANTQDEVYDFLKNDFHILNECCTIYYQNDFKVRLIKPKSNISVKQNKQCIKVDFQLDNVDKTELNDIYNSIKHKKQYHKLKSGEFIELSSKIIDKFEFLNNMNFDFKDQKIDNFYSLYIENNLDNFDISIDKQFSNTLKEMKEFKKEEIILPNDFKTKLRDYQIEGYKWLHFLRHYNFPGILADDMGLGKTIQTLAFIQSINVDKTIIVVPTSLLYNWENEILKHTPNMKYLIFTGDINTRKDLIETFNEFNIILTTYGTIRNDIKLFKDKTFDYCILDEAQYIKNYNTVISKTIKQINSHNKLILTGTPIENNLMDIFNLFDFLKPGYLGTYSEFKNLYSTDILENLQSKIKPFILRRTKNDVLKELKEKEEKIITCELTEKQKSLYDSHVLKIKDFSSKKSETIDFLAILTRLRQICLDPSMFIENYTEKSSKIVFLEKFIPKLLQNGHNILIFSSFTKMLDSIGDLLNKYNIDYFRIDGKTKSKDRLELVNSFNKNNRRIFLISLKAGGTGLNLTGADVVIHVDPWFNPAVENQATDRAHRMGQNKKVLVYRIITKDTIEEQIELLKSRKNDLIENLIEGNNKAISIDDIKKIFSNDQI